MSYMSLHSPVISYLCYTSQCIALSPHSLRRTHCISSGTIESSFKHRLLLRTLPSCWGKPSLSFLLGLLPPTSPLMMASPASATCKLSPPIFSLPNKKLKLTPPSPPNPSADRPPPVGVKKATSPSVSDVLNIFHCQWFLNRDHLIANILSTQMDECSKISWVDFPPMFHTHLVR
jgi:hypothetical protein